MGRRPQSFTARPTAALLWRYLVAVCICTGLVAQATRVHVLTSGIASMRKWTYSRSSPRLTRRSALSHSPPPSAHSLSLSFILVLSGDQYFSLSHSISFVVPLSASPVVSLTPLVVFLSLVVSLIQFRSHSVSLSHSLSLSVSLIVCTHSLGLSLTRCLCHSFSH